MFDFCGVRARLRRIRRSCHSSDISRRDAIGLCAPSEGCMNAHYTANTAKALSLIIPPSILVRADEVSIEVESEANELSERRSIGPLQST
jgi:hypothetical protein